ncbi:MAG: tetratricopeptide repeat protein [Leptothrix sp. (in: b-proteobacteria)]
MSRVRFWRMAVCCVLPVAPLWALSEAVADQPAAAVSAAASASTAASAAAPAASAPPTAEFIALQGRAQAGNAQAQFDLGKAYELAQGSGGAPRDFDHALPWYRKAAEQGHAEAQSRLGAYYSAIDKHAEALPWLEKAAAQKHALATHKLASMYDFGQGVAQDGGKAVALYEKAADLGWPEAMWNLANIYGSGRYGERDMDQACVWATRARKYAEPNYRAVLEQIKKRLPGLERSFSAERLERCRAQAEAWMPTTVAAPVRSAASAAH